MQLTHGDVAGLIEAADQIDADVFMALIGLAIRDQYKELDDFISDCVSACLEYGDTVLAMGDTFETVELETGEESPTLFCIYDDDFDFLVLTDGEESQNK